MFSSVVNSSSLGAEGKMLGVSRSEFAMLSRSVVYNQNTQMKTIFEVYPLTRPSMTTINLRD